LFIGYTILFMLATDAKHPSATSAALGVALTGFQWEVAIAVLGGVPCSSPYPTILAHIYFWIFPGSTSQGENLPANMRIVLKIPGKNEKIITI
jgi:hypothetical protein